MQLKEKMDESFKAGEMVGKKKMALETAASFLSLGKNTKEEIADCTGLSLQEVNELANKMENNKA